MSQQPQRSSRVRTRMEGKGVRSQGAETVLTGDGGPGAVTDPDEAGNTCSRRTPGRDACPSWERVAAEPGSQACRGEDGLSGRLVSGPGDPCVMSGGALKWDFMVGNADPLAGEELAAVGAGGARSQQERGETGATGGGRRGAGQERWP